MCSKSIVIIAIYLIYFFIGGLATTNILRLTSGNKLSVLDSTCICDNCGSKIGAFMQTPIISYVISKGKCRKCKCKIPLYPLFLEIAVFFGMSLITTVSGFTYTGVILSFVYYELIRIFTIIIKKKRETNFVRQYVIATAVMPMYVLSSEFAILIYNLINR